MWIIHKHIHNHLFINHPKVTGVLPNFAQEEAPGRGAALSPTSLGLAGGFRQGHGRSFGEVFGGSQRQFVGGEVVKPMEKRVKKSRLKPWKNGDPMVVEAEKMMRIW